MARLTDQQLDFVTKFTSVPGAIGNASEAARQAGYSARSAAEIGRQLLEKAHVQDAIREANQRLISGQIATKAVALLEKVIDDESVNIKVRVEAAKTILDRGGFGAQGSGRDPRTNKHPSEMTEAEMVDYLARLQRVIDAGARPPIVDVTPEKWTGVAEAQRDAVALSSPEDTNTS
jgi:Terminase small subunit